MSRSSKLPLALTQALDSIGESLLALSDPLAALWRIVASRPTTWIAVGTVVLALLLALALPSLHVPTANTAGWPPEIWPGGFLRLSALLLLGSTAWGKAALSLLVVVASTRGCAHLQTALLPEESLMASVRQAKPKRVLLHSENSKRAIQRRLRLAMALLGYRWHWQASDGHSVLLETNSSRALLQAMAAAMLAFVGLMGLLTPKTTMVEVMSLEPGRTLPSSVLGDALLAPDSSSPPGSTSISLAGDDHGKTRHPLRRGLPVIIGDTVFFWLGSGPALAIEAGGENTANDEAGHLLISFLPGETSKYVTLPETGTSLRVSVVNGGPKRLFSVETLTAQGNTVGEPYRVNKPTTITLGSADLTFIPSQFQVVSAVCSPLLLPGIIAAACLLLAEALARASRGSSFRLGFGERGRILAVEAEYPEGAQGHMWWLPLLRLLLR